MKIGVIGLGVMGQPIAGRLIEANFDVAVFNRSRDKTESFRERALIVDGMQELVAWSDALLFTVPGEAAIDACLGRSVDDLAPEISGKTIVNMATVAPNYSEELAGYVEDQGGRYVEAPICGSRKPAEQGNLLVLTASSEELALEELKPVFEAIGRKTVPCGRPPDAMRMKLANNLLLITVLAGVAELAHFAEGVGLDPHDVFEVILEGPMANDLLRGKMHRLLESDFQPEAPLKHVAKDLRLICEVAREARVSVPLASANSELFARAVDLGLGEADVLAVKKVFSSISI